MQNPAKPTLLQASDAASGRLVLSEDEAAELLNLSPRTLQRMRRDGGGPRFVRMGRRLGYLKADLLAWLDANAATSSSASAEAAAPEGEPR